MSEMGINSLRRLTSKKDGVECRHLLEATKNSQDFIVYIKKHFKNSQWQKLKLHIGRLSEQEYRVIPRIPHADALWQSLEHVNPVEAGKPETWLAVTLQAIQTGIIESHYLAAEKDSSGKKQIENALASIASKEKGDNETHEWLRVSRRILRTAFGFISERGRKAIFTDVPFAVAWWKIYLAKEISKGAQIPEAKVSRWMFHERSKYGEITMRMTGKLTVIADKNIRDGLFSFLLDKQLNHIDDDEFKSLLKHIGIQASWKALGMLSPDENKKIIADCYNDIPSKP